MRNTSQAQLANYMGGLSSSAKNLFADRARWVQTWIVARVLPFAALLALAYACRSINAGDIPFTRAEQNLVGGVILLVVALRAFTPLRRRRWAQALGGHQATLLFGAMVLFAADPAGRHSDGYWTLLVAFYWAMGLAYPKKWFVPGEFAAVSLILAAGMVDTSPPLPPWYFVLLVFGPVALWLCRFSLWKPVILLAALVVVVWMQADFEGYLVPALIAAVALIAAAIYALGKLRAKETSSFIRSVGLGVVSSVLLLVAWTLLDQDPDSPSGWILPGLSFLAIAGVMRWRYGPSWTPLLILWSTHWYLAVHFTTLDHIAPSLERWHLRTGFVVGSLVLRVAAFKIDSNRLLVWSRAYLLLAALVYLLEDSVDSRLLVSVLVLFCLMLWSSRTQSLSKSEPWWKGVLHPRHVVAMRRMGRSGAQMLGSIPFVGATLSAFVQAARVIANMKRRAFDSGDVLTLCCVPIFAVAIAHYVRDHLVTDQLVEHWAVVAKELAAAEDENAVQLILAQGRDALVQNLVFTVSGVLLLLVHLVNRESLFAMLTMLSFSIAPVMMMIAGDTHTILFWITLVASGVGVLATREIDEKPKAAMA